MAAAPNSSTLRQLWRRSAGMMSQIRREASATLRRPARLTGVFRPGKVTTVLRRVTQRGYTASLDAPWKPMTERQAVSARSYESYEKYVAHQASKLSTLDLTTYQEKFRAALRERLGETLTLEPPATVLCLGARLGAEVQAFHDLGHLAIGVDLNPGLDNSYVLQGDFHDLVFPDACFDLAYTNTIDHVFDLGRLLDEVGRVLRPDGRLLIEVPESSGHGEFEALAWADLDVLLESFDVEGWIERSRHSIGYPWDGWGIELVRQHGP